MSAFTGSERLDLFHANTRSVLFFRKGRGLNPGHGSA